MGVSDRPNGFELSRNDVGYIPRARENSERKKVILCSGDALLRDCLAHALIGADYDVESVTSVDEWLEDAEANSKTLFLLVVGSRTSADLEVRADIEKILALEPQPRLVIAGDLDDPMQVIDSVNSGVKGYFSPDTHLNIALAALELVQAGGVYLPPSIVSNEYGSESRAPAAEATAAAELLTLRQKAVVAALRKGLSNKIIAYELNMCESTVKVHIRNIMKKLGAKNRTEVAFLTQKLFQPDEALLAARKKR